MDGIWNVCFGEKPIGTCRMERRGLYWQLSCRCARVTEGICRLAMQCAEKTVDLGVLVPMNGGFGLDRMIPVKNLPEGRPYFAMVPQRTGLDGDFIPVLEGEDFSHLSRLMAARFATRGGRTGVLLNH